MDHTHHRLISLLAVLLLGLLLAIAIAVGFATSVSIKKHSVATQPTATPQATAVASTSAQEQGILLGTVTIGPNCPVQRIGASCTASPKQYASHPLVVLAQDDKTIIKSIFLDTKGKFTTYLDPGTYILDSATKGIGFISKDLPKTITITPGQIQNITISFDTGIR